MSTQKITLENFIAKVTDGTVEKESLAKLILNIAKTIKAISVLTAKGALAGMYEKLESQNIQGETQMALDVVTNQMFIDNLVLSGLVAGLVSEENDAPILVTDPRNKGSFFVNFDPLDGSSNVPVNVSVGSIFSVLHAPVTSIPNDKDCLLAGSKQVAAGYALYGPSTILMLTLGAGTHGFTLDRDTNEFLLTHASIHIPEDTTEFSINASNERFWEPPIQRYINECNAGLTGSRVKDFNMRWVASMVADVHRILMRGGIYLYPKDSKDKTKAGRLRLLYEANPMAMLVEQAGGLATTGRKRILDIQPDEIHQRIPVVIGSRKEVTRVGLYHDAYDYSFNEN